MGVDLFVVVIGFGSWGGGWGLRSSKSKAGLPHKMSLYTFKCSNMTL